jgi:hypothetical protein
MSDTTDTYDSVQTPSDDLPDYDPSAFEEDFSSPGDTEGLRVNFSQEEASSEALDLSIMPTGDYVGTITECQLTRSKSVKNPGKPMYKIAIQIQQGKYARRKLWTHVMLWNGALYSLAQLLKALGQPLDGNVPVADFFIGKQVGIVVGRDSEKPKLDDDGNPTGQMYPAKNNITGFKSPNAILRGVAVHTGNEVPGNSLMP